MSIRAVVAAACAGVLMLSSAAAMADGGHGGGGHFGGGHFGGGHFGGGHFGGGHFGGGHFRGGHFGGGRSSVFIGGDFGFWPYGYGYDYAPDYYAYPPPVVYAPPPPAAYYAPPVAPGAPAAANPAANQTVDQSYCRQYQGTVMVDGATQPSSGVACRQPDGTWRIVQ
jgi:hypothetical protein